MLYFYSNFYKNVIKSNTIYQARLSGKFAAEIFCKVHEEGDFGENSLVWYHNLLLKYLFEEDLRYSYKIHTLLYHSGLIDQKKRMNLKFEIIKDLITFI